MASLAESTTDGPLRKRRIELTEREQARRDDEFGRVVAMDAREQKELDKLKTQAKAFTARIRTSIACIRTHDAFPPSDEEDDEDAFDFASVTDLTPPAQRLPRRPPRARRVSDAAPLPQAVAAASPQTPMSTKSRGGGSSGSRTPRGGRGGSKDSPTVDYDLLLKNFEEKQKVDQAIIVKLETKLAQQSAREKVAVDKLREKLQELLHGGGTATPRPRESVADEGDAQAENVALRASVEALETEIAEARTKLAAAKELAEFVQEENDRLQSANAALEEELATVQYELHALKGAVVDTVASMKASVAPLKKAMRQSTTAVSNAFAQIPKIITNAITDLCGDGGKWRVETKAARAELVDAIHVATERVKHVALDIMKTEQGLKLSDGYTAPTCNEDGWVDGLTIYDPTAPQSPQERVNAMTVCSAGSKVFDEEVRGTIMWMERVARTAGGAGPGASALSLPAATLDADAGGNDDAQSASTGTGGTGGHGVAVGARSDGMRSPGATPDSARPTPRSPMSPAQGMSKIRADEGDIATIAVQRLAVVIKSAGNLQPMIAARHGVLESHHADALRKIFTLEKIIEEQKRRIEQLEEEAKQFKAKIAALEQEVEEMKAKRAAALIRNMRLAARVFIEVHERRVGRGLILPLLLRKIRTQGQVIDTLEARVRDLENAPTSGVDALLDACRDAGEDPLPEIAGALTDSACALQQWQGAPEEFDLTGLVQGIADAVIACGLAGRAGDSDGDDDDADGGSAGRRSRGRSARGGSRVPSNASDAAAAAAAASAAAAANGKGSPRTGKKKNAGKGAGAGAARGTSGKGKVWCWHCGEGPFRNVGPCPNCRCVLYYGLSIAEEKKKYFMEEYERALKKFTTGARKQEQEEEELRLERLRVEAERNAAKERALLEQIAAQKQTHDELLAIHKRLVQGRVGGHVQPQIPVHASPYITPPQHIALKGPVKPGTAPIGAGRPQQAFRGVLVAPNQVSPYEQCLLGDLPLPPGQQQQQQQTQPQQLPIARYAQPRTMSPQTQQICDLYVDEPGEPEELPGLWAIGKPRGSQCAGAPQQAPPPQPPPRGGLSSRDASSTRTKSLPQVVPQGAGAHVEEIDTLDTRPEDAAGGVTLTTIDAHTMPNVPLPPGAAGGRPRPTTSHAGAVEGRAGGLPVAPGGGQLVVAQAPPPPSTAPVGARPRVFQFTGGDQAAVPGASQGRKIWKSSEFDPRAFGSKRASGAPRHTAKVLGRQLAHADADCVINAGSATISLGQKNGGLPVNLLTSVKLAGHGHAAFDSLPDPFAMSGDPDGDGFGFKPDVNATKGKKHSPRGEGLSFTEYIRQRLGAEKDGRKEGFPSLVGPA